MIVEMRTAKITEKGQIAIPKEMRNKRFKTGTKVVIIAFEDHIELRPIKDVSKSMLTALASEKSLSKDWNSKGDKKAWKNL
ncbi:MAG: AbrB/MazE/SpoVT family DNA-binding domain-containing protein [archaeon]